VFTEQSAGGLHFVGDQAVHCQLAQGCRSFAAEHRRALGHVLDHPAQAKWPSRARGAFDQCLQ